MGLVSMEPTEHDHFRISAEEQIVGQAIKEVDRKSSNSFFLAGALCFAFVVTISFRKETIPVGDQAFLLMLATIGLGLCYIAIWLRKRDPRDTKFFLLLAEPRQVERAELKKAENAVVLHSTTRVYAMNVDSADINEVVAAIQTIAPSIPWTGTSANES